MENDILKKMSVTGRIAYGIMCAEEYLTIKYPNKYWSIVFDKYWSITKRELWDEWMDEVIENIPEYLFEFKDYESSGFEHLSEEEYNSLKELYDGVDNDVNIILKKVYDLANSHAYSSIKGEGIESFNALNEIILLLMENNLALPNVEEVKKLSFKDNLGWGNPFDGTYLSKF